MKAVRRRLAKFEIAGEFIQFLWQQKLWWMIPMVIVLLLFAMIMVTVEGSSVAPFIYVLF